MKLKTIVTGPLLIAFITYTADARVGAYGNNSRVNVSNRSANVNRNANVNNNTNVNRNVNVNNNVNVNRNVNVNGGYYGGGVYHDNNWNWGSFAAGAAVGVATTAVVAAATRPATTTVVVAPTVGTVVTTLPGSSCAAVVGVEAAIYSCGSVYYRPYYQGSTLVYQVVKYP